MKITIKTLQGKPTELDVSDSDTLEDLKKKIAETCKIEVGNQKLIHYGKVLGENNKKLVDCGVKDKDFMVLMVLKVILKNDYFILRQNLKKQKQYLNLHHIFHQYYHLLQLRYLL